MCVSVVCVCVCMFLCCVCSHDDYVVIQVFQKDGRICAVEFNRTEQVIIDCLFLCIIISIIVYTIVTLRRMDS